MEPIQGERLEESPQELAQRLELDFFDYLLLSRALTHRSYLNEHPEAIEDNEDRITGLRLEAAKRLSIPVAALLLALFAMPLGIQPPRTQKTWGAGLSACIGMLVFVAYFAMLSLGVALGETGVIHPVLAVWIPNIVVGAAAFYTLRKMGTEQWQSVSHALEALVQRFKRRIEVMENI